MWPCIACKLAGNMGRKSCGHLCTFGALSAVSLRSAPGVMLTVNGKKALNMVSSNFLGVAGDRKIQVNPNIS